MRHSVLIMLNIVLLNDYAMKTSVHIQATYVYTKL